MSALTIQNAIDCLTQLAPTHLAASWDNVGLMVGDPTRPLLGISVAVDPTFEAVDRAIENGSNLIVTHHPLLFKAPKSLDLRKEPGRTLQRLIKADVSLYAAHTNLDATAVNVALAKAIGLQGHQILEVTGSRAFYKVAVFVPLDHLGAVRLAAWDAGAGKTGNYDRCAYEVSGVGTFRPLAGANPAIGSVGEQETTTEARLEFRVAEADLKGVLAAIGHSHPYEEPVVDVVELHGGEPYGFGLVGDLSTPEPLGQLARRVANSLGTTTARMVGAPEEPVKRVAWMGGSAGDYWPHALKAGADVFITGEVRHHAALDGQAAGIRFIEVGHVGSEQPVVPYLVDILRSQLGTTLPIIALAQTDPLVQVPL